MSNPLHFQYREHVMQYRIKDLLNALDADGAPSFDRDLLLFCYDRFHSIQIFGSQLQKPKQDNILQFCSELSRRLIRLSKKGRILEQRSFVVPPFPISHMRQHMRLEICLTNN